MVEQRHDSRDLFAALLELMEALREETAQDETLTDKIEALREAHMRQTIRRAQAEGVRAHRRRLRRVARPRALADDFAGAR